MGYVKHPIRGFGFDNILLMVLIGFYCFFFHSGERFITKQTDNKKKKKLKKVEQKLLGWGKFSLLWTRNLPLSLERHIIEKMQGDSFPYNHRKVYF